jgi:hypothetical protein
MVAPQRRLQLTGGRLSMALRPPGARSAAHSIDVLDFPPDVATLDRWQREDIGATLERERRARIALFVSVGLFFAWVADVGATFEATDYSPFYGIASVLLAVIIVGFHLGGRWAMSRAQRARLALVRRHAAVRASDAGPLLDLAASDAVVAQYLRVVGRQGRPLRTLERAALEQWARAQAAPASPVPTAAAAG